MIELEYKYIDGELAMKTQIYTTMEELYTDNSRLVYSFAFDYVRNADEAEELAGHIWLKVFENRDKFKNKGRAEVRNYIRIMTRNLAADYARKQHKESCMNSELKYLYEAGEYDICDEREKYLAAAVSALSLQEKELIYLRYYSRLKSRQIADMLEMSDALVRTKIMRAKEKLRREIERLGKEAGDIYE